MKSEFPLYGKQERGKADLWIPRFHAICKMDLAHAKPPAESFPCTLCWREAAFFLWHKEMLWSMEAIRFPQLPSQAVTHVVKNTTTKSEYNAAVCTQAH